MYKEAFAENEVQRVVMLVGRIDEFNTKLPVFETLLLISCLFFLISDLFRLCPPNTLCAPQLHNTCHS